MKKELLTIIDDKNPSLRKECEKVPFPYEKNIIDTLHLMVDYLRLSQNEKYAEKHKIRSGVGLAAPQIGINKCFFAIYYINENGQEVKYGLINPRIMASSVKKCALRSGEGCLSVKQDHPGLVYRYFKITLKAFDIFSNKEIEINAKGYDAIVLQHELDHLSGILYYDRIDKSNPQIIIENSVLI